MIAIIDYGIGNLRSVEKALQHLGHEARITEDPAFIAAAERVVLPGVGAFGAAMDLMREKCLLDPTRRAIESGRPFLGICVGMQVLFSVSEELGEHKGLAILPGRVRRFDWSGHPEWEQLKVPHMGWNAIHARPGFPLLEGIADGAMFYFVHSYYCAPDDESVIAATCEHGLEFCAAAGRDNLFATQFHPEKSGAAGLRLLDNFARWEI